MNIIMIIKHEVKAAFESILGIMEIHEVDWREVDEETRDHIYEVIALNCSDYRCSKKFVRKMVEKSFLDINNPSDPEYYPCYQWFHLPNYEVRQLLEESGKEVDNWVIKTFGKGEGKYEYEY